MSVWHEVTSWHFSSNEAPAAGIGEAGHSEWGRNAPWFSSSSEAPAPIGDLASGLPGQRAEASSADVGLTFQSLLQRLDCRLVIQLDFQQDIFLNNIKPEAEQWKHFTQPLLHAARTPTPERIRVALDAVACLREQRLALGDIESIPAGTIDGDEMRVALQSVVVLHTTWKKQSSSLRMPIC